MAAGEMLGGGEQDDEVDVGVFPFPFPSLSGGKEYRVRARACIRCWIEASVFSWALFTGVDSSVSLIRERPKEYIKLHHTVHVPPFGNLHVQCPMSNFQTVHTSNHKADELSQHSCAA